MSERAFAEREQEMMDLRMAFADELESVVEKALRLEAQPKPVDAGPIPEFDPVKKPVGYTSHPSGIECIDIVEHLPFLRGNAIKYLYRAGTKDPSPEGTIRDLEKARQYINREINKIKGVKSWD